MANIIADINDRGHLFQSSIDFFFQKLHISGLLSRSNFYKEAGFSCTQILKELFALVFTGKNLYRALSAKDPELSFRKNTAYRFLNCGYFNWEKLLYLVMSRLIAQVDRLTGSDRESVLIIDDSLFSRNNSKKVELLARVFDHTSNKFCRGFRMLTLGWSDGNTFLPVLQRARGHKALSFPDAEILSTVTAGHRKQPQRQKGQNTKPNNRDLHQRVTKLHKTTIGIMCVTYIDFSRFSYLLVGEKVQITDFCSVVIVPVPVANFLSLYRG